MRYTFKLSGDFYLAKVSLYMSGTCYTTEKAHALRFWTRWGARRYLRQNVPEVERPDFELVNLWRLF